MEIKNREKLVSDTISRVINNAPISEILRVYSLAVQSELDRLSDDELIAAIEKAGYLDLIEDHAEEPDLVAQE